MPFRVIQHIPDGLSFDSELLGDLFRERFGGYAGWAQQYLFLEDLKMER